LSSATGGILMTMHRMSQGGADRVAVLLANGFHAAGIPTDLLLLRSGGEGEQALSELLDPGVRLHSAGPPMGSRHLELVRGARAIRALAASARSSLVLASSSNMGLVTGVACRLLRAKGVRVAMKLTNPVIRPHDRSSIYKAYRTALYRFTFRQHDRVLTLTDAENRDVQGRYPDLANRFATVANPYVAADLLQKALTPRAAQSGPPQLLAIARMMPQKRLDVLLEAFSRLSRRDARLTILGDGPLRRSLEAHARTLGIADRVAMPGFVDDVQPALAAADLLVLSSDYEGLPAAVIEALAGNVPVVTTDCFLGAREMLGGSRYCGVTPVGDPAALASAIDAALIAGPPTGLREITAPYGIDASIAAHIAALRPLIEQR
jgi:glycosyltransferase involved in cell wall biosynthesis